MVHVKDFAFSPKSKGIPLKSISQVCVLESVDRLEEDEAGQEARGGGSSSKIGTRSTKDERLRLTGGLPGESVDLINPNGYILAAQAQIRG